jgi:hypothetical protein
MLLVRRGGRLIWREGLSQGGGWRRRKSSNYLL